MVYAVFSHRQSTRACLAIFLAILSLAVFITGCYHYLQDPVFHQNMFALLTAVVVLRSMWIMELLLRPSRRVKGGDVDLISDVAEQARVNRRDEDILKTMWTMIGLPADSVLSRVGFLFGTWITFSAEPCGVGTEILACHGAYYLKAMAGGEYFC
jgi:dihydroceramidase